MGFAVVTRVVVVCLSVVVGVMDLVVSCLEEVEGLGEAEKDEVLKEE